MARFKVWRKTSSAAEDAPKVSNECTSASVLPQTSTTPPGSPQATFFTSSAPIIAADHFQDQCSSSRQTSLDPRSTPQTESSEATEQPRWFKEPAGHSVGPWQNTARPLRAFKPPPSLLLLDTAAHNPRSPIAWFIDQLGVPLSRIIPRPATSRFAHNCEYELGNLNISRSIAVPLGYREPQISSYDFIQGGWRTVPIFTTAIARNPLRMTRACEVIGSRTERITIAFKVFFLDTDEHDKFVRMSYEASWTYLALDKPTMGNFYDKYGEVLSRTTEEHRAAREWYLGPWMVEGRGKIAKIPKMYEESAKFLRVDGCAERTCSKEMKDLEKFNFGMDCEKEQKSVVETR